MTSASVRIEADVLVPGRGPTVDDGAVVINGTTITYAGPRDAAPDAATTYHVPALMPGLWDCHGHFFGAVSLDLVRAATTPLATSAARAAIDAGKALAAGVTSVRETGGLGIHLSRAVDEGIVPGPRIYPAGGILSTTGGHGDIHCFPLAWMDDLNQRDPGFRLCDGVPECLRAVREQLRENARLIKICASGGVLSEVDDPIHQQFCDEELRAIVEEAARAERIVAAHCHGKPGIVAALRAGVRPIEHGTYLDDETATMMRDTGAILVPTRTIVEDMLALGEAGTVPEFAMRKLRVTADRHFEALQLAISSGVRIAMGTDIVTSLESLPAHWGANAMELVHLVKAGMSPLDAIEAATAIAPETLGPQAPKSGLLAAGYDADVIAVTADPSLDVSVLTDPANVTHVWKAGALVKPVQAR